jgi:hypothetical protein
VIIEQIPDKSIKLQIDDTHILVFQLNEIEKITEEPIKEPRKKTYQGTIETGYAIGVGYYGENNYKLNFINSIKYSPYLALGIGGSYAGFSIFSHHGFGGVILNSAFGASMRIFDKSAILAGISCEMQKMELGNIYGDYNDYRKNLFSLGINIGISF